MLSVPLSVVYQLTKARLSVGTTFWGQSRCSFFDRWCVWGAVPVAGHASARSVPQSPEMTPQKGRGGPWAPPPRYVFLWLCMPLRWSLLAVIITGSWAGSITSCPHQLNLLAVTLALHVSEIACCPVLFLGPLNQGMSNEAPLVPHSGSVLVGFLHGSGNK